MRSLLALLWLAAAPPARAGDLRLTLTGDALTATPLSSEQVGVIPFGKWLNGITLAAVQHGFQFSANLEQCAVGGCLVTTEDATRALVAKSGVAEAIRLGLYEEGWGRTGLAAISEEGRVAIPMAGPGNQREIWVLKPREGQYRMQKRIPYDIQMPPIARWRDEDLYLLVKDGETLAARRVNLTTGALTSVTMLEPWCFKCVGGEPDLLAVGFMGERPEQLAEAQAIPITSRSGRTGWLEVTGAARPLTAGGLATPVRLFVDCYGRIEVVSALGEEIWCLRFGRDGVMEGALKLGGGIAGDAKSVQLDERGRFYYLETEMKADGMTPAMLHLVRLK